MTNVYLGIDVGSTTVKVVALDQNRTLLAHRYVRSLGQPRQTLLKTMKELSNDFELSQIAGVGLTGSGGGPITQLIGGYHINELIAQTRAVGERYPEARTVIEIGGQDSKFLSLEWNQDSGKMVLVDFAMNALCAAGTGSFLDQQAERLDISIENEFSDLATQSNNPARVAGRCTVFAKSDMIHLQQKGTPIPDILSGLCMALARNFKSVIGKGKAFTPPILFQGGVAYNQGVKQAFEKVLNLSPGQLIVPSNHWLMAALGTAHVIMDEAEAGITYPFHGFEALEENIKTGQAKHKFMQPLVDMRTRSDQPQAASAIRNMAGVNNLPVYLGIDVGSISTNVVLIDEQAKVVARRYLHTAGKPLEAVRRALQEIAQEVGEQVTVCGVGTTGSGRHLTAHFVGGDVIRNEITAQARAATAIDPKVDTVFEIGGQDSKFISLDHGAVVDFAMNNACAAGTGSFLEEQADRLKINIKEEFSELAMASEQPSCLGERCTVFMESDLVHYQQQGAKVDALTAGLAYSTAQNYLNRVASGRNIGKNIFFQGGVAWNQSVVAAFQTLTGRQITVPPNHDVTGAIGVAILAMETLTAQHDEGITIKTQFKGFDLSATKYESELFECKACTNVCEINKIEISGEPAIYYGAKCDKFEEAGRTHKQAADALPDLFTERNDFLMGDYTPPGKRNGAIRLAVPRALTFYDVFPYWRTFFAKLNIELLLSDATNSKIISQSSEHAAVESCFPAKLVYGHVLNTFEQDADYVFLPSMVSRDSLTPEHDEGHYCTFIPTMPHLVTAHIDFAAQKQQPLKLTFHMQWQKYRKKQLAALTEQLKISQKQIDSADELADKAQQAFQTKVKQRGQAVLANLPDDQPTVVLVGRPYNTYDLGACQNLPFKLRKLGILAIPMDYLPLDTVDLSTYHSGDVSWRNGQAILAAAAIIRNDPRLQAIYVTNFNCGPDSFLLTFFRRIMGDKPFLELEFDDHTADAGVITRCEAFFESLQMGKGALA